MKLMMLAEYLSLRRIEWNPNYSAMFHLNAGYQAFTSDSIFLRSFSS